MNVSLRQNMGVVSIGNKRKGRGIGSIYIIEQGIIWGMHHTPKYLLSFDKNICSSQNTCIPLPPPQQC